MYINIFDLSDTLKKRLNKRCPCTYAISYEADPSFHHPTFTVEIEFSQGDSSIDTLWSELNALSEKLAIRMSNTFDQSRKF